MLPPHCVPQGAFLTAISSVFGTCIPSPISLISTTFGVLSMLAWLCAQLPQVYKNRQNRSVEGLSWIFLAIWLAGDICNFSGAILLRQQFFQISIGAYYVFIDTLLVFQFYQYGFGAKRIAKPVVHKSDLDEGGSQTEEFSAESRGDGSVRRGCDRNLSTSILGFLALFSARASAYPVSVGMESVMGGWDIGQALGWTSCILYFSSRIPQICKNQARRSTDGLSPLLFMAAFCGNFFYSASLLSNPLGWNDYPPYGGGGLAGEDGSVAEEWWGRSLPFFLGAWSVVIMDAIIGIQFWRWPAKEVPLIFESERQRLLSDATAYGTATINTQI